MCGTTRSQYLDPDQDFMGEFLSHILQEFGQHNTIQSSRIKELKPLG